MRFILAIVGAMCAMPASAQQPTPCDLLAGHVEDPDRVGPGAADVADKKAAITACEKISPPTPTIAVSSINSHESCSMTVRPLGR